MATSVNRFIDSNTFATATAVYTDALLTTKAPDGLYQDCGIYRYQDNGLLGDPITCPFCSAAECGQPVNGWEMSNQGYYEFDITLGTSTGLWIVKLDPSSVPDGIIVTYDGVDYSSGVSPFYGFLSGPYFGTTAQGTAYNFPNASPYYINKMAWDGVIDPVTGLGTNFVSTGDVEVVSIVPADFSDTATSPGEVHLFIAKPAAEPQTATIKAIGPVGGTSDFMTLTNNCVVSFVGFTVSAGPLPDATAACAAPVINTYYNGPVNGTLGEPGLYDVVYVNQSGTTLAATLGPGFYGYSSAGVPTGYFEIDANSVIITIGTCPP